MNQNETKQRLIKLIAEHQFAFPGAKLGIGELSEQCGISRQSFNRYYADLKPYALGKKPISELLADTDNKNTSDLLNKSHLTLLDLNKKIAFQERQFQAEKAKAVESYITSLMNDDLLKFNTNELRQTLERTVIHNEKLSREIDNLKLEMIKVQQKSLVPNAKSSSIKNKVIINPDLTQVFNTFNKTGDDERLDSEKDAELEKAISHVNRLTQTSEAIAVIFAERYISSFEKFAAAYIPTSDETHIILRLPVFNRALFPAFIKRIKSSSIYVYVPFCDSQIIRSAQRAFHFRNIPDLEFKAADNAHTVSTGGDIDLVCTFKVRQGD